MIWNYRVILHDLDADAERHWYGVHEVYYDKQGEPRSWTVDAVSFGGDREEGPEGVTKSLQRALEGARKPVLLRSELERGVGSGEPAEALASSGQGELPFAWPLCIG